MGRSADFAQYKTYSWEHVKTQDPLYEDRIKNSVNAALAARGWTQVDSGADVSIVAMEITRNQQTLNTFYDGFGGGWGKGVQEGKEGRGGGGGGGIRVTPLGYVEISHGKSTFKRKPVFRVSTIDLSQRPHCLWTNSRDQY